MVVENYKEGCFEKTYERYNSDGRLFPEGLHYLNSWVIHLYMLALEACLVATQIG